MSRHDPTRAAYRRSAGGATSSHFGRPASDCPHHGRPGEAIHLSKSLCGAALCCRRLACRFQQGHAGTPAPQDNKPTLPFTKPENPSQVKSFIAFHNHRPHRNFGRFSPAYWAPRTPGQAQRRPGPRFPRPAPMKVRIRGGASLPRRVDLPQSCQPSRAWTPSARFRRTWSSTARPR